MKLIDITMYGYNEEEEFFERCRIMIDRRYQNKGCGTAAIRLVLEEMKKLDGCTEVYLSTDPENTRGKHVYEKVGFCSEHRMLDDEEQYKLVF